MLCIIYSMSVCDLRSSQRCREQWTRVTPRLIKYCIPNCVYVLKCRNTMWLYRQYNVCATSQIVWYNSKWGRIQRKENVCTVCLCLCTHAWVKLCVLILSVCGCIVLIYCCVLHNLWLKTASSLSWGGSCPTSILTRNTCSVPCERESHRKTSESGRGLGHR